MGQQSSFGSNSSVMSRLNNHRGSPQQQQHQYGSPKQQLPQTPPTQRLQQQAAAAAAKQQQEVTLNDPNLTDDTFVVEAPSFIVPYVYEKPPKETIKDFKLSVEKLQQDLKKSET